MRTVERHERIIEILRTTGRVEVSSLSKTLGLSEMTIRRDLKALEESGQLTRVHGGAVACDGTIIDLPLEIRKIENLSEKIKMAAAATELIQNHEAIALDASTSALELAKRLKGFSGLTVVTNNLMIALELGRRTGVSTHLTGGNIRSRAMSLVGPAAVKSLLAYRVNKAFISANAFSCENGLTDASPEETEMKKAMMDIAQQVIALVDPSKFGRVAFMQVCPIERIDVLITTAGAPEEEVERLQEVGVKVIIAP
ncbi:MAG: DeoR/GlpR transcriptional regulator [Firmicutes bacterium]|nr:DeoR/GlpR transcriptional regulator [Bacillota bacterium]